MERGGIGATDKVVIYRQHRAEVLFMKLQSLLKISVVGKRIVRLSICLSVCRTDSSERTMRGFDMRFSPKGGQFK